MAMWWTTLAGVVAGCLLGASLYNANCSELTIELIGFPGELYLRALQQLVLPLTVLSLMTGVFSMRNAEKSVAQITQWCLGIFLVSMLLAVMLGITLVAFLQPGRSAPFAQDSIGNCNSTSSSLQAEFQTRNTSVIEPFLDIGRTLVPENIVTAAAHSNYLAVGLSAVVSAFALNCFGHRANHVIGLIELFNDVVMKITSWVIWTTPVGVCSLTSSTMLKSCDISHTLNALALYAGTVLAGLFIHSFIVLPVAVIMFSGRNPYKPIKNFLPALLMGLGTSSGAVTMPVTMESAQASGCDLSLARFIIPFATNVNRDGSALYEAISVFFICQAHGLELSLGQLLVLAIAAVLAAVGCGPVPNSGLVTMIAALQTVGFPQYVGDVSLLYALDWLLGSLRTSVNIWSNGCACIIVDEWSKRYSQQRISFDMEEPLLS